MGSDRRYPPLPALEWPGTSLEGRGDGCWLQRVMPLEGLWACASGFPLANGCGFYVRFACHEVNAIFLLPNRKGDEFSTALHGLEKTTRMVTLRLRRVLHSFHRVDETNFLSISICQ